MQHVARDSNANQVSDLCDLLSCVDPVAFLHSCGFLDLSVTREDLAMIDLQSKGVAIEGVRSASDGAVGDRVNPGTFLKIQVAAGMGTGAVVSIRTKGTRRMSPVRHRQRRKVEEEFSGIARNVRLTRRLVNFR